MYKTFLLSLYYTLNVPVSQLLHNAVSASASSGFMVLCISFIITVVVTVMSLVYVMCSMRKPWADTSRSNIRIICECGPVWHATQSTRRLPSRTRCRRNTGRHSTSSMLSVLFFFLSIAHGSHRSWKLLQLDMGAEGAVKSLNYVSIFPKNQVVEQNQ